MKAVITGGTGFVGSHLGRFLVDAGNEVTALGTRAHFDPGVNSRFHYIRGDTTSAGDWQEHVARADLVFNLAGRTIFRRWSRKYKSQIYDSRIRTTRHVVEAMPSSGSAVLISTSAVGYYGDCGDRELAEDAAAGNDFLAGLGKDWEAAALAAEKKGVRVVLARFGIVLGADGGALSKMIPSFRSFVGGPLGDGRQWFPWIHLRDVIRALAFLASRGDLKGPFNLCAPNPVRNGDMARALGAALGRPAKLPVPAFALRTMMGELAGVLLGSQRAIPASLLEAGFQFEFPGIDGALEDIVRSRH